MSEGEDRVRAATGLLRQLWLGLSAYRLFPGSVERPGFVAAVERIEAAARAALATGSVDVEIRGDRLILGGEEIPSDEQLRRLALACFERRVERLVVTAVPDAEELGRLYSVLSTPESELSDAGGADQALRALGVTSVSLSAIGPSPVEGADHVPDELVRPPEERPLDADVLASELMVEDLHGDPVDQAETLLSRLRSILEGAAAPPGRTIELHAMVHNVMSDLPADIRRSLVEILIDHVRDDPLAERLIGTMSNAELTRALVDLGGRGRRDPVELARQLAQAGVRQIDIVDLTRALEAGHEEAGTIITGLEQLGIDLAAPGAEPAASSVSEILSEYLSATEADDVRAMRQAIDATQEQARSAALLALGDYLSLETDLDRVGEVLEIWIEEVRRALRERNSWAVQALLQPVGDAMPAAEGERRPLMESAVRRGLDRDLILELVASNHAQERPEAADLLAPFGDLGVEVLLDFLADEEDRNRRAMLLAVLRRLARGHLGPVRARLTDPRWYVVRNAVSVLGSASGPEALDVIALAARHESAAVRREVVTALVAAGGAAAVPHLSRLASEGDEEVRRLAVGQLGILVGAEAAGALAEVARTSSDRALRLLALQELAHRPDGSEILRALGSRASRPRLPWGLRRRARALVREKT